MQHLFMIGFAVVALAGITVSASAQEKKEPIRALLITGDDVAPFHDWREMSETTRSVLMQSGKFDVKVCEDAFILDSKAALDHYDLILFMSYNATAPDISDQAKENLLNFVKSGKGLMINHLASASYKDWAEFGNLCGRKWVMGTSGHSTRDVFTANVVKKDHPITEGMEDFKIYDELYSKLQGDTEIEVLVSGNSTWSNKTEPLFFVHNYGKGRVVHDAFGHDHTAILDPNHKKLLIRGCEWAATGKVTKCGCGQ